MIGLMKTVTLLLVNNVSRYPRSVEDRGASYETVKRYLYPSLYTAPCAYVHDMKLDSFKPRKSGAYTGVLILWYKSPHSVAPLNMIVTPIHSPTIMLSSALSFTTQFVSILLFVFSHPR